MKKYTLFCFLLVILLTSNCKNRNPNMDKEELITELMEIYHQEDTSTVTEAVEDTIVTDMRFIGTTPTLKDWKNYLLTNNKYKDWDKNDKKEAAITYVVEKNGKASHIEVGVSSGNEELDNEALRLVEEGEFTVGTDITGNEIRTGSMWIVIPFPSTK